MQSLIRAGLFGAGLTLVETTGLVERYNNALGELGIDKTSLSKFHIDGIGWSPEVAEERGNNFYLCAGEANPMGVIITPDQRSKPLYHPYSSYERDLMEAYFSRYHGAIADITSTSFIGLDIDQELTKYETPYDLVLVRNVILRSVAGGLFDAAGLQKGLISRIEADDTLDWFDVDVRKKLIESGNMWGDLRHRRTDIPSFQFNIASFYTRAFGGSFVFRSAKSETVILVLEDAGHLGAANHTSCQEYTIDDSRLAEVLLREQLAEISLVWYAKHPEVLADKKETMLACAVCQEDPDINYVGLKIAQKRQWAAKLRDKLPQAFHLIERLSRELQGKGQVKAMNLDPELRLLLMRPSRRLVESEQEVVWRLLCRLQKGFDVLRLYVSDKEIFFSEYKSWPSSKKNWAINLIRERYVPRMNR